MTARGASLLEIPDGSGQVFAAFEFSVGGFGEGERGRQRFAAGAAEDFAGGGEGLGAAREEAFDEEGRLAFEGIGGKRAGGEPGRGRFGPRGDAAGEDPLGGARFSDPRRQENGRRGRETTHTDLRESDARVLGRENHVAGGRELGAAAEARARDRSDGDRG